LTTDKENRKPKSRKRKRAVPLEWKRKGKKKSYEIQDLHTEHLKEVMIYLNGRYALLVGPLVD
jgi:hypothetical protein